MTLADTAPVPDFLAFTDGACSGNPGPMGIGALLLSADGSVHARISQDHGFGTNNRAEYLAVIAALTAAIESGARSVEVRCDSKLVVGQVSSGWVVSDKYLVDLRDRVLDLIRKLPEWFTITWIPREQNGEADALARKAIYRKGEVARAPVVSESFASLARLRVPADDPFTHAPLEVAREHAVRVHGGDAIAALEQRMLDVEASAVRSAVRWAARGLSPEKAERKARVDLEVRAKAAQKTQEAKVSQ